MKNHIIIIAIVIITGLSIGGCSSATAEADLSTEEIQSLETIASIEFSIGGE